MIDIPHAILRMIVDRDPQSLFAHDALPCLEHFGNKLMPGLVACLNDSDAEVRRVAIDVLAMTRPQSDRAVPLIVERLADEDRLVRLAAIWHLREEFGPMSVAVVPFLESWLNHDDEYGQILALTSILTFDPRRTELASSPNVPDHPIESRFHAELAGDPNLGTPIPGLNDGVLGALQRLIENHDYERAKPLVDHLLTIEQSAEVYQFAALIYARLGNCDEALTLLPSDSNEHQTALEVLKELVLTGRVVECAASLPHHARRDSDRSRHRREEKITRGGLRYHQSLS